MEVRKLLFNSDNATLHGELISSGDGVARPTIVMSHGLSGIFAMDLPFYADHFVKRGFTCFMYDHRNWGLSSGWPRCETDPWRQISDMREAISFVRQRPEVHSEKIGLWGTSYSGGHVLTVGALDMRVTCIVSQVPLISGSRTFEKWIPEEKKKEFLERIMKDLNSRAEGAIPQTTKAALVGSETEEWVKSSDIRNRYVNQITLRTFDLMRTYEPLQFVNMIEKPVALIVAKEDTQTPVEWQVEAFEKIRATKKLYPIEGRHYDVYGKYKQAAAEAASEWFSLYLLK